MMYSIPSISFFACDQPESGAISSPAAKSALAETPIREPRYEATLLQGIEFRGGGLPLLVRDILGISRQEDWGAPPEKISIREQRLI